MIPLTVPLSNWIDDINCSAFLLNSLIENNSYTSKKIPLTMLIIKQY